MIGTSPGDWCSPTEYAPLSELQIAHLPVDGRRAPRLSPSPPRAGAESVLGLSRELDLPFTRTPLKVSVASAYPEAIAAGIAPLDEGDRGPRFALAPEPGRMDLLRRHRLAGRRDVVLMPRDLFRTMVRRHHAGEIARRAADGVGRVRPEMSARSGAAPGQIRFACALAALILVSALASPVGALSIAALVAGPIFLALVWLRCSAVLEAWRPPPLPRGRIADPDLPVYTVLVALNREEKVVAQLYRALAALDYPPERLDIKFIVEHDDPGTRDALLALGLPDHMEVVAAPAGAPRTKPRALNIGLMEARGELLTIFDAEDRPDPRQLRLAANVFRREGPAVACLQARLVIDNADDTLLTRFFALEYAGLFDVINAGLLHGRLPVLLGGTSNHFRTSALRAVGGWDAWNVTEDADLAFRLTRAGFTMSDLPSATLEEAPGRLRSWFRQRTRWMKGFIQTGVTHTRDPGCLVREAGWSRGACLLALCVGTVASALGYPFFLAATIATLAFHGVPSPDGIVEALLIGLWFVLIAAGLVAIIVPAALGARRRGLGDLTPWLLLLPVYHLLISAAAWAAVLEYLRAPFRWNKTEHGQAVTSRRMRGLITPP